MIKGNKSYTGGWFEERGVREVESAKYSILDVQFLRKEPTRTLMYGALIVEHSGGNFREDNKTCMT